MGRNDWYIIWGRSTIRATIPLTKPGDWSIFSLARELFHQSEIISLKYFNRYHSGRINRNSFRQTVGRKCRKTRNFFNHKSRKKEETHRHPLCLGITHYKRRLHFFKRCHRVNKNSPKKKNYGPRQQWGSRSSLFDTSTSFYCRCSEECRLGAFSDYDDWLWNNISCVLFLGCHFVSLTVSSLIFCEWLGGYVNSILAKWS